MPIVSNGTIFKAKDSNGCLFADIQIGEQTVRFYDVQLFSNNVSDIADNLVEQGTIVDDKAARSVGRMLARVRRTAINRAKEVELVKNHAAHSPFQTIICGDLNDIPVSYTYHTLHDGLQDAFQLTGSGVGTTYAGNIPALRIDYIFTSPNIVPVRCEVPHVPFSDHFPVVGDFILK